MVVTQVAFGAGTHNADRRAMYEAAEWYLASLSKNGQLYGEYVMGWVRGELTAYVYLADSDASQESFHSEFAKMQLASIREYFGRTPSWTVLGDNATAPTMTWESASSLYLFTHAFDDSSPVCHGDTGQPVPAYRLPLTERCREDLDGWARLYHSLDHLWFDSGTLEIPAYEQLAAPDSELSRHGRNLCSQLEQATGKPTYYYLHRYWGCTTGESDRVCPACGRPWRARPVDNLHHPWHDFPFRCERCRLVSSDADGENDQYAHIGEYKQDRSESEHES